MFLQMLFWDGWIVVHFVEKVKWEHKLSGVLCNCTWVITFLRRCICFCICINICTFICIYLLNKIKWSRALCNCTWLITLIKNCICFRICKSIFTHIYIYIYFLEKNKQDLVSETALHEQWTSYFRSCICFIFACVFTFILSLMQ